MDKKLWFWLEGMDAPPPPAEVPVEGPPPPPPMPVGTTPAVPPTDVAPGTASEVPPDAAPESGDTTPDVPQGKEDSLELLNFDQFRDEYIDATVNEKPDALLDKLGQLRGIVDLGPKERKFLSDNIQILLLMREQEIYEVSRKLHRIESPLDLIAQFSEALDETPLLRDIPIKLPSFFGMKSDLYRKFVAALCGGVQIGGGATVEDIVVSPTKGQRHLLSTRFYTTFGSIEILPWALSPGDPDLFLKEIERERLKSGSPEEKSVLTKRILLASISKIIKGRVFVICVMNPASGKRTDFGLQLDQFLLDGYSKGLLQIAIVEDKEKLGVLPKGETTNLGRIQFLYQSDVTEGKPVSLLEVIDGVLYLVGDDLILEDAINTIGNGVFNKSEFEGTDEELDKIQRCVPTIQEMLLKRC